MVWGLLLGEGEGEEEEDELERCRAICCVRDEILLAEVDCASVGVEVASERGWASRFGNRLGL